MDQSVTIGNKSMEFPGDCWQSMSLDLAIGPDSNSEGRNICKKISQSLLDRSQQSKGSRMFQQQRKRASKFTTVGYGTQPPENGRNSALEDEMSSLELSGIDYSSDNDSTKEGSGLDKDFEDNFELLEKKKKQQYRSLAMDVNSMKGKGAKIFVKRQKRMENYVITDENRRQSRRELANPQSQNEMFRDSPTTRRYPFQSQSSGYNTDMEDECGRPNKPRVNYFSDCEGTPSDTRGRSMNGHRTGWKIKWNEMEPDVKYRQNKRDVFISPHHTKRWNQPVILPGPAFKSADDSRAAPNFASKYISSTAMKPPINGGQPPIKRTWARVAFNPRKPLVKENPSAPVIAYPCVKASDSRKTTSVLASSVCNKPAAAALNMNHTRAQNVRDKKTSKTTSLVKALNATSLKLKEPKVDEDENEDKEETLQPATDDLKQLDHDEIVSSKTNKLPQDDVERRSCSPASVTSYTSSNSSVLPSCPPANPPATNSRPSKPTPISSVVPPQPRETRKNQSPLDFIRPITEPRSPVTSQNQRPDNKLFACLKVLDPAKIISNPKPLIKFEPSPTLNALVKMETDTVRTPMTPFTPQSCQFDAEDTRDVYSPTSMNTRMRTATQLAQPLGAVADGMKGKGAKMFEKQQKRMQKYTKETSKDDYPEMQNSHCGLTDSDFVTTSAPNGFLQNGDKLESGDEIRNGMQKVIGEFQKSSKPGKAKAPSETKRKGRDPLYYQQFLFCRPPSASDFVEPTKGPESSALLPCATHSDSLSSHQQDHSIATSPTASASSLDGQTIATTSSSSLSSRKSAGPRTAPKPPRAVIERQLSKSTSPEGADSNQSYTENQLNDKATAENEKTSIYIGDLMQENGRKDGNSVDDFC